MDYLRILHGSYNIIIALTFIYQGWLGIKIRNERKAAGPRDLHVIRRHRILGPTLVLLSCLGYLWGAVLVFIGEGRIFEFPLHNITGAGIVILVIISFLTSRRIKGLDSQWRTPHFVLGIGILCVYIIQVFIGLDILF
jgi:hypothetical protein